MLKKKLTQFVVAFALALTIIGSSGLVADSLGLSVTPQVMACENGSGIGGGC